MTVCVLSCTLIWSIVHLVEDQTTLTDYLLWEEACVHYCSWLTVCVFFVFFIQLHDCRRVSQTSILCIDESCCRSCRLRSAESRHFFGKDVTLIIARLYNSTIYLYSEFILYLYSTPSMFNILVNSSASMVPSHTCKSGSQQVRCWLFWHLLISFVLFGN